MSEEEDNNSIQTKTITTEPTKVATVDKSELGAKCRKTKNIVHPYDQATHKIKNKSGESSSPPPKTTITSIVIQNIDKIDHVNRDNNAEMEIKQNNNDRYLNREVDMQSTDTNNPNRKID